jgi:hypothetical protein
MAKSSTFATNPVTSATTQAIASGSIARSICDSLILNYGNTYEDEMDALLTAIRKGKITVLERR